MTPAPWLEAMAAGAGLLVAIFGLTLTVTLRDPHDLLSLILILVLKGALFVVGVAIALVSTAVVFAAY